MIEIKQTDAYRKWFGALKDTKAKARINLNIRKLTLGNDGNVRSVGGGVFEVKIDQGPGYRVYFVKQAQTIILLLIGGDKSTQRKDIANAKKMVKLLKG